MQISQKQQSLMQRLLMGTAAAGNGTSTTNSAMRNGIEDIAARLQSRNNGTSGSSSNGNGYTQSSSNSSAEMAPSTVWSNEQQVSISNHTPSMHLTCVECGIHKNNSEDMEVHIKMEHLNWLPFQCPICLQDRASDAQMREHLFSAHKKCMNKFIYVDNVNCKRQLQVLMDKALSEAMAKKNSGTPSHRSNGINGRSETAQQALTMLQQAQAAAQAREQSEHSQSSIDILTAVVPPRKRAHETVKVTVGNTNTDALLASITRAAKEADYEDEGAIMPNIDDDVYQDLFSNSKRIKSEFDARSDNGEDSVLDGLNPISVLDDMAALFAHTSDGRIEDNYSPPSKSTPNSARGASSAVSKKRVLGECSKCQKPVTAGARQMHMFFHLAKDHDTYRFRCLFDNCHIEHYRKDQMENHQSKIHGKIDPSMMEDRSLELFHRCQELNHELFVAHRSSAAAAAAAAAAFQYAAAQSHQDLSMELLGTKSGSTPGPTAAKAEVVYQAQQAAAAQKEREKVGKSRSAPKITSVTPRAIPDEEHPLECRLCHKTMQNRIRGFHILWHMAKDMGINRYACKYCGFGHDRSQSVQVHGKKEHNSDDCVHDRIGEYSEEVKQMSESCFGFQALFAQETKRRSKIPLAPKKEDLTAEDSLLKGEVEEIETSLFGADEPHSSQDGLDDIENGLDDTENVEEPEQEDEDLDEEYEEKEEKAAAKRRRTNKSTARFGMRKHKSSKSKREEMSRLREVTMLIGGTQYFKKKLNEHAECEKCGKVTTSRLSEHAYTHMDVHLFLCPKCDSGHQCRDMVIRHIRDFHESDERPVDNRLRYAGDIKQAIKECYPLFFIDAPIPTAQDVQKIRGYLTGEVTIAGLEDDHDEKRESSPGTEATEEVEEKMLDIPMEEEDSMNDIDCGLEMEEEEAEE